jgi:hypothetical protein
MPARSLSNTRFQLASSDKHPNEIFHLILQKAGVGGVITGWDQVLTFFAAIAYKA